MDMLVFLVMVAIDDILIVVEAHFSQVIMA
jgi:hypothetical protein